MIVHHIIQAIFLLAGVIALLASLLDWEWFFTTENTRYLVKKFKRKGVRWIYGIAGVLLFVISPQPYSAALMFAFFVIKVFMTRKVS